MGSGNRDVDNDGEPDHDSSLSLHRAAVARRARLVGRRSVREGTSAEIYSPPYLFNGSRPTITSAPTSVAVRAVVFVGTPDATSISNVTLIALSSVTHGFNMGQRISRPAVLASYGRPERDGAFKPQHHSAGLLHAVHPEFERRSFNSKDCPNQLDVDSSTSNVDSSDNGSNKSRRSYIRLTAPCSAGRFSWTPGSSHTITTSSLQSGGAGVRSAWHGGVTVGYLRTVSTTRRAYTANCRPSDHDHERGVGVM